MSFAQGLYQRFRGLIGEAAPFGVVGAVGWVITNGGYAVLHYDLGAGYVSATTIATIIAAAVSYVGNRYWSFRHRERTNVPREAIVFLVLNGFGIVIQDVIVAFNAYVLDLGTNKIAAFFALNAGIALGTVFRFWSYRKWVWAEPAGGTGPQEAAAVDPVPPLEPADGGSWPIQEATSAYAVSQGQGPRTNGYGTQRNGHAVREQPVWTRFPPRTLDEPNALDE